MVTITEPLISRDEDIDRASRSLKAMSHPLRLKILCTLGDQEISVQDIVESVGTSQSNISQHLAILRDKGLLRLISMMREVFCSHD
jgi:ArsR family transcriptional regulator